MRISIAQRACPFSHQPGTSCIIPKSSLKCQVFPTKLVIQDLSTLESKHAINIDFSLGGPVEDFTVQQDLEKGLVRVWGHYKEGFVRYFLQDGKFKLERAPEGGVYSPTFNKTLLPMEEINLFDSYLPPVFSINSGRLSLGSHKAQNWDLIRPRADLADILPVWFCLGRQLPKTGIASYCGTLKLLQECEKCINERNKLQVYQSFVNLFRVAFNGILTPSLTDDLHQGFQIDSCPGDLAQSPLTLLTVGAKLISKLFIQIEDQTISVLPLLPPEFHCGRMLDIKCNELGEIDIEWSKKLLRRMIFRSKTEGAVHFVFQKELKAFRLRTSTRDKGRRVSVGEPFICTSDTTYFFDNFTK